MAAREDEMDRRMREEDRKLKNMYRREAEGQSVPVGHRIGGGGGGGIQSACSPRGGGDVASDMGYGRPGSGRCSGRRSRSDLGGCSTPVSQLYQYELSYQPEVNVKPLPSAMRAPGAFLPPGV